MTNGANLPQNLVYPLQKCILQSNPRPPALTQICVSVVKTLQTALYKYSWITRPTANRTELNLIKSTQHALCSNIHPLAATLLLFPLPPSPSLSALCLTQFLSRRRWNTHIWKVSFFFTTLPYYCTYPQNGHLFNLCLPGRSCLMEPYMPKYADGTHFSTTFGYRLYPLLHIIYHSSHQVG